MYCFDVDGFIMSDFMLMWFYKAKSLTENSNSSLNSIKNIYKQLNNLKCAITLLLWRLVPYKVLYSAVLLPAIAYQQLDYEKSTSEGQFQVACAASANTSELRSPLQVRSSLVAAQKPQKQLAQKLSNFTPQYNHPSTRH